MQPKYETIRVLGKVLREHLKPNALLPAEMQALLLRLALRETERAHYCGRNVA